MSLSVNPANLTAALLFVERAAGRSCIDSMNRAGRHAIIGSGSYSGAMQLTPKASRADIQQVTNRQLTGYVIKRAKARGEWPLPSAEIRRRVAAERKRRMAAVGYAAYAGWSNAAKAFGGRGVKGVNSGFNRSQARFGKGKKARVNDLTAELTNTAPAAENIGFNALQQGIDNAARDLVDYGTRKLQEQFDRVQP